MAFQNPWIGFVDRSYQQIKEQVLTVMYSAVPEITDHTESNLFVKIISIWAAIAEMLGYYIDNAAREVFLSTARRYESAVKIAKLFDYRIRGTKSASVELTFTLAQTLATDLVIPAGTIVTDSEGTPFKTIEPTTITAGVLTTSVDAEQKVEIEALEIGTSNGLANQEYALEGDVVDKSFTVNVGAIQYTFVESLAFSDLNDEVFTASLNGDKQMVIKFGDNFNGKIPPNGDTITIDYSTSVGAGGNLSIGSISTLATEITVPGNVELTVTNLNRSSGGADIETLADLKRNIPLSIRTLNNAVTVQDFEDIAELQAGVRRASVLYDCGAEVDVYIAPEGGGIASDTLINEVREAFYDETRLILMDVNILSAGSVRVIISAEVNVLSVYNQAVTRQAVLDSLTAFLSVDNQEISGRVNIGDLYQTIENTEGVDHCSITLVSMQPTARRLQGDSDLVWVRNLTAQSNSIISWEFKYIGNDIFEFYRQGSFLGQVNLGQAYSFPEIQFTINANVEYEAGDSWEFKTYPYNANIVLDEPSIPIAFEENINLEMVGGV